MSKVSDPPLNSVPHPGNEAPSFLFHKSAKNGWCFYFLDWINMHKCLMDTFDDLHFLLDIFANIMCLRHSQIMV